MRLSPVFSAATLLAGASLASAQNVHINEVYASHTGDDTDEYIELIGPPGTSLDSLVVCIVEGEGGGQGILDRVWDLTGSTIPASGYFFMGNTGTVLGTPDYSLDQGPHASSPPAGQNNIENGTETVYLISAANPLAISDLETAFYNTSIDPDLDLITIFSVDPNYTILDSVGIVHPDYLMGLDSIYDCAPVLGPDLGGPFFPAGVLRDSDYPGEWCNDTWLDFNAPTAAFNTPGAANPMTSCSTSPSSTGCSGATPIGMSFCGPAVANSTGLAGSIAANGSTAVADMDVVLEATNMPQSQFGYFIASMTQGFIPGPGGSMGNLCVQGNIARFNSPGEVFNTGTSGSGTLVVDTTAIPANPTVPIVAGDTWNFQCWYRDVVGGSGTSNFTDGRSITFN